MYINVYIFYIFWILTFHQIYHLQVSFSRSICCRLGLSSVSFTIQKVLFWCSPNSLFLLLFPLPWETYEEKDCYIQCQRNYCVCSLLGLLWFQVSHLMSFKVLNPFWIYFYIWCKKVVQFCSFACSCPVFPAPFAEKTIFSPSHILSCFVKD